MLKLALSKIDRRSADKENCARGCQTEITPYDQCSRQPLQSSGPINSNHDAVHVTDHQLAQCSRQPVQSSSPINSNLNAVHLPDHQLAQCSPG